ncbi:hypothetical protein NUW58_g2431 [Xylaria curta]|uniref:Uncharacterized protein n=1 Tax=Xylaria curta TaxID=42375 RepID=A0ACC1PH68_9PEZI|nr:hypothetical protein NUW58_g2431 [Xylaria curta]
MSSDVSRRHVATRYWLEFVFPVVVRHEAVATVLLAGLAAHGYSSQIWIFPHLTNVQSLQGFLSQFSDSMPEWVTVVGQVIEMLAGHERYRCLAPGMEDSLAYTTAVAWQLDTSLEAIHGWYPRHEVPLDHVAHCGVLSGVVKIEVVFAGGTSCCGTGVLIDPWTIATAGHVVYSQFGSDARLVRISAGLGDDGRFTESRYGAYVVVHNKWYSEFSRPHDLAFIHLLEPLDNIRPIRYMKTPVTSNLIEANVYGFPDDMPYHAPGQRLCVSKSPGRYGQSDSIWMFAHMGDSYNGTSGGAILDINETLLAIHEGYDPISKEFNVAVVIDHIGNDFYAFREILRFISDHGNPQSGEVVPLGGVQAVRGTAFGWGHWQALL